MADVLVGCAALKGNWFEATGWHKFWLNRLFSFTSCSSLCVWNFDILSSKQMQRQSEWNGRQSSQLLTLELHVYYTVSRQFCKGGETRCPLNSISRTSSSHICLHHIMTLQIAPTPFDDVRYEHQTAWNGKIDVSLRQKLEQQQQKKKNLIESALTSLWWTLIYYIWKVCLQK